MLGWALGVCGQDHTHKSVQGMLKLYHWPESHTCFPTASRPLRVSVFHSSWSSMGHMKKVLQACGVSHTREQQTIGYGQQSPLEHSSHVCVWPHAWLAIAVVVHGDPMPRGEALCARLSRSSQSSPSFLATGGFGALLSSLGGVNLGRPGTGKIACPAAKGACQFTQTNHWSSRG